MKKILIITYYWPPSGGSGVQRWLKFVKYLPSLGWEPHVFTPENPSFAVRDPSLERDVPPEAEVTRFPIWEPYDIFYRISGLFGIKKAPTPTALSPGRDPSMFQNISAWIRGNLFVPDPRRFWVRPSVKFLSEYLRENNIHTIITTGPPHSLHLIGLALKARFPKVQWLADFRDPWSEWGLWDSLKVSAPVRALHRKLERRVLAAADEIITITPFYVRRFEQLSHRRVTLLTNGFDEEDFEAIRYVKSDGFVIRHIGIVNEKCDPRPFMIALQQEMAEHAAFAADVKVEFIGEVHRDFWKFVSSVEVLNRATTFCGNIPHRDLIALYGSSALLLLILTGYKDGEGFLPGKLFEYLATGLPVLGVGPVTGDAATVLRDTGAGRMIDDANQEEIRRILRETYAQWKAGDTAPVRAAGSNRYSRREITRHLADILSARSTER
jgi:glycosyltransferase involved in cell wall biosynthesis